ncbi:ABC transporter ATP-binding protein [Chryseobacterium salivictor]|uniref:Fluoroquinolones export ATP-binding protein n=1 Tax=Chryseobacterium salivictor TaxID=2547600 RepID=A0A4P6ZCS3_9FLAO|nr:ABC transporter ATP-binding protein [Chryseobacterium salivictor]QBO57257.1 Fluoroquinolones export ATP-binding protein [Chryseobacterium salivictor]
MIDNIIEIKNLNFGFDKNKPILKDVNLMVPKGSIYGFLGSNGAGKSTTMRLIMGLFNDDANSVKVFDTLVSNLYPEGFNKIGSLIDYPAFYDHLSGYDNLMIVCILRNLNISRIDEILELVGLTEARNIKMKKYSLGMKQRLAIGLALISDPELLVLDEPVNGLDPNGMKEVRELLIKLNKEYGVTVFISSHLLLEIEKMVTHIGIISNGEIKFQGSKEDLNELYRFQKTKFSLKNAKNFEALLAENYQVEFKNETDCEIVTNSPKQISDINKILVDHGAEIHQISPAGGLEEWFMEISKQN